MSLPIIHALCALPLAQMPASDGGGHGGLIALAVLAVVAVGAWLLLRKPPAQRPDHTAKLARPGAEQDDGASTSAERKKHREQAGSIKLSADGQAVKITPEQARQIAKDQAEHEALAALRKAAEMAGDSSAREQKAALAQGLQKTKAEGFIARLGKLFAGKQIDESLYEEIEEVLLRADLGVKTTHELLQSLKDASSRKELANPAHVWKTLREKTQQLLDKVGQAPVVTRVAQGPAVIMVVGVNGSGKTTSIGKLAHRYSKEGHKVLVAAADTFRAAAVDQLEVWCQRADVPIHRGKENADPASVCFAAIERAKAEGFDLVILDTAGRLHTNQGLMEELSKCARVSAKALPGAPHETLLVLDATMGQNAVKQAELFRESVPVTGIVLTKLDGTAKGGVVLAIASGIGLPVKLIGVGEKMSDLRDFDAALFVEELFDGAGS